MSLREIGELLSTEKHVANFDLDFMNPIPFIGESDLTIVSRESLCRSLLELSDLEEKVARNALNEGSCVRIDSLPIRGDDQWLLIDCDTSDFIKHCIPPYYFLERAVPKGLKIVLVDVARCNSFPLRLRKVLKAVGRAVVLRLDGLIIYDEYGLLISIFLKSFISALQEQKDGEFESPLEVLSFNVLEEDEGGRKYDILDISKYLCSKMIYGIGSGKLRNLKYVNIGFMELTELVKEYPRWWNLQYTCPNLQVLELWRNSDCDFPPSFQCPDNVYGPHNCCVHITDNGCGLRRNYSSLLGLWIIKIDEWFFADLAKGLFSSLRVLMCTDLWYMRYHKPLQGLGRALYIGCPALQFLQIINSQLCAVRPTDWHGLFKRLLVLIVICMHEDPIFDTALFPEGCELRVLTIVLRKSASNALLSWLETLLNSIDICLPKLLHLNVFWYYYKRQQLATAVRDNYISQFRQKSANLVFVCDRRFDL